MMPRKLLVVMHEISKIVRVLDSESEAVLKHYQSQGWGVFRTVNSFDLDIGRKELGVRLLNSWYCETDKEDKEKIMASLFACPLVPSRIVESKSGYHIYWNNKNPENMDNLKEYRNVCRGLSDYFKADRLWDVCRMLREPGWMHLKNPEDPFLVREIMDTGTRYTSEEMLKSFPPPEERTLRVPELGGGQGKSGWIGKLIELPVQFGLEKLSGTKWVNGDVYGFSDHNDGTYQIVVNGSPSSSWIDEKGMIGSHKRWGPSIYRWLMWYHRDRGEVRRAAWDVFGIK